MSSSLIAELFAETSARHANRIAVYALSEGVTRTFSELRDDVAAIRAALEAIRLGPRPSLVVNIGNRAGFIALFVAALELGSDLLLLDGDASPSEALELADTYGAQAIVVRADAEGLGPGTPETLPCGLAALVRRGPGATWRGTDESGPFILKVTSGSTGAAKAVIASEHNVVSDGRHVIEAMDLRSTDTNLAVIPIAHSYGLGNLLLPLLLAGAPVAMRDRFVHRQWANDIVRCHITTFPAVPFIFDYLRRAGDVARPLAVLRLLVTAGAPMDVRTLLHFKERFGIKIHSLYGTSETGSISFDSSEAVSDPVSVGWPVPETTIALAPIDGIEARRVLVHGTAVCQRYAFADTQLERSAEFTPAGFLTADLGSIGQDGRLTLLGRVSDVVNVAGRKVHPGEVERVIVGMPDVVHAFVLGITSGARGEVLVACVHRRRETLTAADVRAHCAIRLAVHKVPKRVVFADELPADARGKHSRRAIEAFLAATSPESEDL